MSLLSDSENAAPNCRTLGVVSLGSLVAPDTWFDYGVRCVDTDAGTHIMITINGVVVTDVIDTERRYKSGHFAIQQHHDGSVISVRRMEVREL